MAQPRRCARPRTRWSPATEDRFLIVEAKVTASEFREPQGRGFGWGHMPGTTFVTRVGISLLDESMISPCLGFPDSTTSPPLQPPRHEAKGLHDFSTLGPGAELVGSGLLIRRFRVRLPGDPRQKTQVGGYFSASTLLKSSRLVTLGHASRQGARPDRRDRRRRCGRKPST
jgi:hypothetical protein